MWCSFFVYRIKELSCECIIRSKLVTIIECHIYCYSVKFKINTALLFVKFAFFCKFWTTSWYRVSRCWRLTNWISYERSRRKQHTIIINILKDALVLRVSATVLVFKKCSSLARFGHTSSRFIGNFLLSFTTLFKQKLLKRASIQCGKNRRKLYRVELEQVHRMKVWMSIHTIHGLH